MRTKNKVQQNLHNGNQQGGTGCAFLTAIIPGNQIIAAKNGKGGALDQWGGPPSRGEGRLAMLQIPPHSLVAGSEIDHYTGKPEYFCQK